MRLFSMCRNVPHSFSPALVEKGVDLVVDTRETWKQFFSRVWNFDHAPLVERTELPPDKQPHRSVYGKLSCYINGISPYPPARPPEEVKVQFTAVSEKVNVCEVTECEKPAMKKEDGDVSVAKEPLGDTKKDG